MNIYKKQITMRYLLDLFCEIIEIVMRWCKDTNTST